jgi:catechol 2,3-dioxygenase-like lactoylglutathione lyase family enzyme
MIEGLYETHLDVEDLERAIDFYTNVLGLEHAHTEEARRIAFFWIGEGKRSMLGVWEKPKEEIETRHFAFRCDRDFVVNEARDFLRSHGLSPFNFLNDGTEDPMVFAWMPAIAIYFDDPDGHHLEFIAVLDGEGRPEHGIVSYEGWLELEGGGV